jgi:hypothetical protein
MYSQHNKPMSISDLPDGYVINAWDGLHNSIAQLYMMCEELGQLETRGFLSEIVTEQIVKEIISECYEIDGNSWESTENLLRKGHKGLENYTDMELCVEVQNTIAGWCGMEQEDDFLSTTYSSVKKEVDEAIALILTEVVEKDVL